MIRRDVLALVAFWALTLSLLTYHQMQSNRDIVRRLKSLCREGEQAAGRLSELRSQVDVLFRASAQQFDVINASTASSMEALKRSFVVLRPPKGVRVREDSALEGDAVEDSSERLVIPGFGGAENAPPASLLEIMQARVSALRERVVAAEQFLRTHESKLQYIASKKQRIDERWPRWFTADGTPIYRDVFASDAFVHPSHDAGLARYQKFQQN